MLTLAINCADAACDVAVLNGKSVLSSRTEAMRRGQDARLPGIVQDVLEDSGVELRKIQRIAVVTGPGSFTGVRVGVSFARGLALATGITCVGVTSLEAALPDGQQGSAIVLLPAQKRAPDITYWCQRFRTGVAVTPAEESTLEELADLLSAHPHLAFGQADELQKVLPDFIVNKAYPSAERAARVAQDFDPERHLPIPTYARAPDAALPVGKGEIS